MNMLQNSNGILTHIGPDKNDSRIGTFSTSDNSIVGNKSLDYIFGHNKQIILDTVTDYLSNLGDTCLLHYFQYISPSDELKNHPFTFLVSKESENETVFLQTSI